MAPRRDFEVVLFHAVRSDITPDELASRVEAATAAGVTRVACCILSPEGAPGSDATLVDAVPLVAEARAALS